MRRWTVVAVVGVLAMLGVACGGGSSSSSEKASNEGGGVSVTTQATGTVVEVEDGENADGSYFMNVSRESVPAGAVTFKLKNTGTKEHEMVVLKTDTPADQLKVNSDHRVSEADSVGEISETKAGADGTVTLDLKAGKYVLVCNIANHYEKGMYHAFTVTAAGSAEASTDASGSSAEPVTVNVKATDYGFDSSTTTFKVGVPYHFVVENDGKVAHEFMIVKPIPGGTMSMEQMDSMALGDIEEDDLQAGDVATVDVTFDKPYPEGTLEFACHIGQHYEKGMHLPIVVES